MAESMDTPQLSKYRETLLATISAITKLQPTEMQGVDEFVMEQVEFFMELNQCIVCKEHCVHFRGLLSHLLVHSDWMCHQFLNGLRCYECNAVFNTPEERIEHDSVHEPHVPPVYCSVCGQSFKTIEILQRHRRVHGPQ